MEKTTKCSRCRNMITERDEIYEINGDVICETCAEETVVCDHCHQRIWETDDVGNDDIFLCGDCLERFYAKCEVCDAIMQRDDAINYKGTVYCNRCYTETLEDEETEKYSV